MLLYLLLGVGALYALSSIASSPPEPKPWDATDATKLKELLAGEQIVISTPEKYVIRYRVQVLRWKAVPHPTLPIMVCDYIPMEQLTFDDRTEAVIKTGQWVSLYQRPPETLVRLLKIFYDPKISADPIGAPDELYVTSGPKNQPGPCG
jgi:hypothetical protein